MDCKKFSKAINTVKNNLLKQKNTVKIIKSRKKQEKAKESKLCNDNREASIVLKTFFPCFHSRRGGWLHRLEIKIFWDSRGRGVKNNHLHNTL